MPLLKGRFVHAVDKVRSDVKLIARLHLLFSLRFVNGHEQVRPLVLLHLMTTKNFISLSKHKVKPRVQDQPTAIRNKIQILSRHQNTTPRKYETRRAVYLVTLTLLTESFQNNSWLFVVEHSKRCLLPRANIVIKINHTLSSQCIFDSVRVACPLESLQVMWNNLDQLFVWACLVLVTIQYAHLLREHSLALC